MAFCHRLFIENLTTWQVAKTYFIERFSNGKLPFNAESKNQAVANCHASGKQELVTWQIAML